MPLHVRIHPASARDRAQRITPFVVVLAVIAGCGGSSETGAGECKRFCVSVSPTRGDTETVFHFAGHGWLPGREVTATYGVYCRPGRVCILLAKQTRILPGADGEFVFRFRNGPQPPTGVPRPRGFGSGPVAFRQRTGARGSGQFVTRTPRYFVNRRPVGPRPGAENVP